MTGPLSWVCRFANGPNTCVPRRETLACMDELVRLQRRPLAERLSAQLAHEVLYTCGSRVTAVSSQH